jgi:large subunit ribosomal protein L21
MYAIVDIAGQQFKVEKDKKIYVHRLEQEEGSEVEFDQVLLIENDDKVLVGEPVLKGALVTARVLSHMKGDKVLIFKKKRRKGYQKLTGHRQSLTQIQIQDIVETGGVKKPAEPKAAKVVKAKAPKAEAEAKVEKTEAPKAVKTAKKSAEPKLKPEPKTPKAAAKKPAASKTSKEAKEAPKKNSKKSSSKE